MQVTTVEPDNIEQAQEIALRGASVFEAGGLVVFPTETVYGVGASAASEEGITALRRLRTSGHAQAFTVHLPERAAADLYIDTSSPALSRLMKKVFPGPVTLVVDVADDVIDQKLKHLGLPGRVRDRIYHQNTVGLRCPDHPLTQRILSSTRDPVVATSANRPGHPRPREVDQAVEALAGVDLVVDGGRCRYARPSTVVRVRGCGPSCSMTVERSGVYDERFIRKLIRWTVLFVCSGNTCRSPMAEAIARQILSEQHGIAVSDLEAAGWRVLSAGVFATAGIPASQQATEALAKQGLDLSHHRARQLTPEMAQEADVVYGMTEAHCLAVGQMVRSVGDKTERLDPGGDIEDPMGSDISFYQRTAELIRRQLTQRLKE